MRGRKAYKKVSTRITVVKHIKLLAQIKKGENISDILRDCVDVYIEKIESDGKSPIPKQVTDKSYKKPVTQVTKKVTPKVTKPKAKRLTRVRKPLSAKQDSPVSADTNPPEQEEAPQVTQPVFEKATGKLKCDGHYIRERGWGEDMEKLPGHCIFNEEGYCLKGTAQPINCPKLTKALLATRRAKVEKGVKQ